MDLQARISAFRDAIKGATQQGTSSSGSLEDADADDLATLERLREEATRACLKQCEDHLDAFLRDVGRSTGPPPTYEEWINYLHPENSKRAPDGSIVLDTRFYVELSDHRRLWNKSLRDPRCPVSVASRQVHHVFPI